MMKTLRVILSALLLITFGIGAGSSEAPAQTIRLHWTEGVPAAGCAGHVPQAFCVFKFGSNSSIGTSRETMWTGSNLYTWQTAAYTLTVSSSDVKDTAVGVGARTVTLYGLDANYIRINETLTLLIW